MEIAIAVVVGLLTLPVIAWFGRRSGQKAIGRLGSLAPDAIRVVSFMTGAAVKPLRQLDPAVPQFSPIGDRFRSRVLITIADHADLTFWRSGRDPQLLLRLPIARLQSAVMVPMGLNRALHLALHISDGAGRLVTIPLIAHGASGVKGRPGEADLRAIAAAILALQSSR